MAINRRERFSVLETEITKSIETLKEAIRLDKELQSGKEKRQCLYFKLNCTSNALKEFQMMVELDPTDVMKEYQTTLENELNDIQDLLSKNLQEVSTIGYKLYGNSLLHCTERIASYIREAIGIVHDEGILEVEKMYQQSQNQVRILEETNQRNAAEIWKLRSENENLKAVMDQIRDHLDYSHSADDTVQKWGG